MVQTVIKLILTCLVVSDLVAGAETEDCKKILEDARTNFTMTITDLNETESCQEAIQILAGVKTTQCLSDVSFRIVSFEFKDLMKQHNVTYCDLAFERNTSQSDCTATREGCVNHYVDELRSTSNSSLYCNYLSEYIQCLQSNSECRLNSSTLTLEVNEEKTRFNGTDCAISVLTAGAETEDCNKTLEDALTNFTRTITELNETERCQEAKLIIANVETTKCPISLEFKDVMEQHNVTNCDFAFEGNTIQSESDNCSAILEECVNQYEDKIRSNSNSSFYCTYWSEYIQCLQSNSECRLNSSTWTAEVNEEKTRFNGTDCVIAELEVQAVTSGCNVTTIDDSKAEFDAAMKTSNETAICRTAQDSLTTVKKLHCLSDTRFRLYYLGFESKLAERNYTSCVSDLESEFYPNGCNVTTIDDSKAEFDAAMKTSNETAICR
ncbi:hypothetical protein Btru_052398 [Bulinus truncatus]|nr:hypothetical protein Btru_052398 [Bulinus truncatus]